MKAPSSAKNMKLRDEAVAKADLQRCEDYTQSWQKLFMKLLPFTFVPPVHSPIAAQYQRPLFESMVSAGFPSPAQDYYDGYLNLHQ